MTPKIVLWIYLALLVIGGLVGFLKAGSRISLVSALISALLLTLAALFLEPYVTDILLGLLALMFAWRWFKTRKFMPSGLMLLLTVLAWIARQATA